MARIGEYTYRKIGTSGNAICVRLPRRFTDSLKMGKGTEVKVTLTQDALRIELPEKAVPAVITHEGRVQPRFKKVRR
jgi:antitoxin component of MazEF toxin-antitoxin module